MPLRPKPTRELLDRIVANYRQTGDITNAAIRSGISRSTCYEWKARGEKAKSGLLAEFAQKLLLAREEDIAVDVMRHQQVARGGVFPLPVHDKQGRVQKDENGKVLFEEVVMLPNRQALETRLRWKAPDRYPGNGDKRPAPPAEPQALPDASDYAKPAQLEDMLADVFSRLQARGIEFKPSIETTAKKEQETTPEPLDNDKPSPT
jgi:hypothetical protein